MSSHTTIPPGGGRARIPHPRQPLAPLPPALVPMPSTHPRPSSPEIQPRISPARKVLRYLHLIYIDLLFMALFASIMGALSFVPNFKTRSHLFPMWIDPGTKLWVGPVEYSYPYLPFILSTTQAALVDILVPVATILLVQIWVRRFWDANAAMFALFKALIIMTLLQQILKLYIGGLRPYFLSVCAPSLPALSALLSALPTSPPTTGYHRIFVSPSICSTPLPQLHKQLALASFPSGHAGNAFAAATVLALYLNAKLHAFAKVGTGFWKQLAVLAPLVGAALVAGNELRDHHHHIGDVLAGVALGTLAGAAAYRAHYASLWDGRTNHEPLPYAGMQRALEGEKRAPRGRDRALQRTPAEPQRPGPSPPGALGFDGPGGVDWAPAIGLHRVRSHTRVRGGPAERSSTDPTGDVDWQISSNGRVRSDRGGYSDGRIRTGGRARSDATAGGEGIEVAGVGGAGVRAMRFSGSMRAAGPVVGINGVLAEGEIVGGGVRGGSLRWV